MPQLESSDLLRSGGGATISSFPIITRSSGDEARSSIVLSTPNHSFHTVVPFRRSRLWVRCEGAPLWSVLSSPRKGGVPNSIEGG
jgi:hypothetical protein